MKRNRRRRAQLHPLAVLALFLLIVTLVVGARQSKNDEDRPSGQSQPSSPDPASSDGTGPAAGDALPWNLLLVNGEHPLPEDFSVELTQLKSGHAVDSRMYEDLQAMLAAAKAQGLSPVVCSSYRSWDKQQSLFDGQVAAFLDRGYDARESERQAAQWVAPPGTSEHQSGLAVDIVALSYQILDEGQEDTAEQQWLMANCQEYGFILRYPSDKAEITSISYEPWHYRYVGRQAAREIAEQGLCLEEYVAG